MLRLIQKWLDAGIMEEGEWKDTEVGTPQGSVVSPLLANIYLHYVLDLWVDAWRKKSAHRDVVVVRYADDNVLGFQHWAEADRFLRNSGSGCESLGWSQSHRHVVKFVDLIFPSCAIAGNKQTKSTLQARMLLVGSFLISLNWRMLTTRWSGA